MQVRLSSRPERMKDLFGNKGLYLLPYLALGAQTLIGFATRMRIIH